jgi:hypothetical protein
VPSAESRVGIAGTAQGLRYGRLGSLRHKGLPWFCRLHYEISGLGGDALGLIFDLVVAEGPNWGSGPGFELRTRLPGANEVSYLLWAVFQQTYVIVGESRTFFVKELPILVKLEAGGLGNILV